MSGTVRGGIQPFPGIDTEEIPVVQAHGFQQERIFLSFICKGGKNSFLVFQGIADF